MSRTTVKAVWPGDHAESIAELGNGWLSAPVVWDAIAKKYIGPDANWLLMDSKFWKLAEDDRLPEHQCNVFRLTFDNAVLYAKDYARATEDIRKFFTDFPWVNRGHWDAICDIISAATCPAIGFHWTSVTEDPFASYEDDDGNPAPLDWSKYWDVYAEETEVPS